MVDQLSGAGGSAQADGFEACLPRLDGISGAEDQLLAKLVYRGGARQHGRAGDPEVLQDALDGTGKALRMVGFGSWLGRLSLAVRQELTVAPDRGAGEGEDVTWRADVGGDCGDGGGGLGACGACVVVGVEQGVDAVAGRWREGVGDVESVGEAAGGYEQPPGLGGGADLAVVGCGDLGQGLAGLVHGRDDDGQVAGFGGEGVRGAGGVGGAEGRGPAGVGVGEPSGPQGQVGGFGGGGCDGAAGVGGDPVPRSGGVQPGRPGLSGGIGAAEQPGS